MAARTDSLPAPVGGWNARDPEAAMDPRDALDLINIFPRTGDVILRKGYSQHATGFGDPVETLMPYNGADGTQALFVAAGTAFYNATTAGSVGAAVQSGLSNSRWQHVNYIIAAGTSYLCAFNGVDSPRYWDGSNWTTVNSGSSPGITGVTTSGLDAPWIHKRRMWLVEADTMSAWYLPVDAVGGAANEFDLSGLFKRGGYLVAGATWTVDAGEGMDDYWVAVTSEGEVAIYQGTDPSSASTWALVGIWYVGEPIGKRCFLKYGGDLLYINRNNVMPFSKALQSSQVNPKFAITDKISGAFSRAISRAGDNFGWQLEFYPQGNMVICNIPISSGSEQYVMNTLTGAWARFKDIAASCWCIFNNKPYFGADDFVGEFWQVNSDNNGVITGDIQQAFSYFGSRGSLKHWSMLRPILSANGTPSVLVTLNVDYERNDPSAALSFTPSSSSLWGTAVWGTDSWATSEGIILKDWQGAGNIGTSAGLRMTITARGLDVSFQACDYVFERGGVI